MNHNERKNTNVDEKQNNKQETITTTQRKKSMLRGRGSTWFEI